MKQVHDFWEPLKYSFDSYQPRMNLKQKGCVGAIQYTVQPAEFSEVVAYFAMYCTVQNSTVLYLCGCVKRRPVHKVENQRPPC